MLPIAALESLVADRHACASLSIASTGVAQYSSPDARSWFTQLSGLSISASDALGTFAREWPSALAQ